MTRTTFALSAAVIYGTWVGGGAWADISVEEARDVAEAASGTSLDDATVATESSPPGSGRTVARFTTTGDPGSRTTHEVDLTDGRFTGFVLDRPSSTGAALPDAAATAAAQAAAEQYMGDDAQGLVWSVAGRGNGEARLEGQRPYLPDPSRTGLTPSCSVCVGNDGVVTSLVIHRWESEPLAATVTLEQALAIAEAEAGAGACTPLVGPHLVQRAGQLYWGMELLDSTGEGHLFHIDARSGAVLRHDVSGTKPYTPEQRMRHEAARVRGLVLWCVVGGALLVLGLATVAVVRRRRNGA